MSFARCRCDTSRVDSVHRSTFTRSRCTRRSRTHGRPRSTWSTNSSHSRRCSPQSRVSGTNSTASLGRWDVRRRAVQAFAIDELAPDLGDHAHFASVVTGFTRPHAGSPIHRYVGFAKARVRDRAGGATTFADYVAWLEALAAELDR